MKNFSETELSQIKEKIKQFNPNDFLNYLAIISCYSKNTQYHELLEFLYKFTLTIPEKQFKGEILDIEKLLSLFTLVRSLTNWSELSDIELNLEINYSPIWIFGRRYRLPMTFKGKSYQQWKSLVAFFFPVKDLILSEFKFDPIYLIEEVLNLNDAIVDLIDNNNDNPTNLVDFICLKQN